MFNPPPNLGQLRDGLNYIGITLVVSAWKVRYNTDESREINQAFIAKMGRAITYDRQFIARFVGLLEREICCIEEDHRYEVIEEKACQILVKWRSMESNSEKKAYSKLVNAIHCIHEHTGRLEDMLWYVQYSRGHNPM